MKLLVDVRHPHLAHLGEITTVQILHQFHPGQLETFLNNGSIKIILSGTHKTQHDFPVRVINMLLANRFMNDGPFAMDKVTFTATFFHNIKTYNIFTPENDSPVNDIPSHWVQAFSHRRKMLIMNKVLTPANEEMICRFKSHGFIVSTNKTIINGKFKISSNPDGSFQSFDCKFFHKSNMGVAGQIPVDDHSAFRMLISSAQWCSMDLIAFELTGTSHYPRLARPLVVMDCQGNTFLLNHAINGMPGHTSIIEHHMLLFGMASCVEDRSLFARHTDDGTILTYINGDQIVIASTNEQLRLAFIKEVISPFQHRESCCFDFEKRIDIAQSPTRFRLTQRGLIKDVFQRFKPKSPDTYVIPFSKILNRDHSFYNREDYQQASQLLEYYSALHDLLLVIATSTRPEILQILTCIGPSLSHPEPRHHEALLNVLGYLNATSDTGIAFKGLASTLPRPTRGPRVFMPTHLHMGLMKTASMSVLIDFDLESQSLGMIGMVNSDIVFWSRDFINLQPDETLMDEFSYKVQCLRDRLLRLDELMSSRNSPMFHIPVLHSVRNLQLNSNLERILINENINIARLMDKPVDQPTFQSFVQSIYNSPSRLSSTNRTATTSSLR